MMQPTPLVELVYVAAGEISVDRFVDNISYLT